MSLPSPSCTRYLSHAVLAVCQTLPYHEKIRICHHVNKCNLSLDKFGVWTGKTGNDKFQRLTSVVSEFPNVFFFLYLLGERATDNHLYILVNLPNDSSDRNVITFTVMPMDWSSDIKALGLESPYIHSKVGSLWHDYRLFKVKLDMSQRSLVAIVTLNVHQKLQCGEKIPAEENEKSKKLKVKGK